MKRIKGFFLAGILVLFVVLAVGCTQLISNGEGGSSYFPDDQGNTWEYINSDDTSTITEVDGVRILPGDILVNIFKTTDYDSGGTEIGTSEDYYRVTDTAVYNYGASGGTFDPPLLILEFPLSVGKTWTVFENLPTSETTANVVANETVDTFAGEFDCYKVRYSVKLNDVEVSSMTHWFAEDVGKVKMISGSPEVISVLLDY